MICPRCRSVTLVERERDGLLIDVCSTCRGVWLDRGELDKLLGRASREHEDIEPSRDERVAGDRDDHDEEDHDRRAPTKKRRWMDTLGGLFD